MHLSHGACDRCERGGSKGQGWELSERSSLGQIDSLAIPPEPNHVLPGGQILRDEDLVHNRGVRERVYHSPESS